VCKAAISRDKVSRFEAISSKRKTANILFFNEKKYDTNVISGQRLQVVLV